MSKKDKHSQQIKRFFLVLFSFVLSIVLVSCRSEENTSSLEVSETEITKRTTTSEESDATTKELQPPEKNESFLATEEATKPETTQEPSTEAFEERLQVEYIGPTKYEGQGISPSELLVRVIYSDGTTEKNPSGWGTDIWKLLEVGKNQYEVVYHDLAQTVVIEALPGMQSGNTACQKEIASDAAFDGQVAIKEALNYLNVSIHNYGALTPIEGLSGESAAFVRLIYQGFGFALPYEMEKQMEYGISISKEELKTGDLVFVPSGKEDEILAGIYVGGDWVLSTREDGKAEFYWCNPIACRRIYQNTNAFEGEECFKLVMNAFRKQGEYGKWVASFIDDYPCIIGRIRKFTFSVNLLEHEDGYYKTYFSYDEFHLPEAFVLQWQKQFLNKNALCEVMKNGEYVRYDENGNEFFKNQVTPEVWKKLTPGIHGEYWNLEFE